MSVVSQNAFVSGNLDILRARTVISASYAGQITFKDQDGDEYGSWQMTSDYLYGQMTLNISKIFLGSFRVLVYPPPQYVAPTFTAFDIRTNVIYMYNGLTIQQPFNYWYNSVLNVSKTMPQQTPGRFTQMGTFQCANIGNTETVTLEIGKNVFSANNSAFIGYSHREDNNSGNKLVLGLKKRGASLFQTIYSNVLTATCAGNLDIVSNNFTVVSNTFSVGINEIAPNASLHVNGNCIITGNVTMANNTVNVQNNQVNIRGNSIITGNVTMANGTLIVQNNEVDITGNCTVTENLAIGGELTDLSGTSLFATPYLEVYLPGYTPWPPDLFNTDLLELTIPTTGVWQFTGRLSLSNDGSFIDLYYVGWSIVVGGIVGLAQDFYTPMAPFQDIPFEITEIVQVNSAPIIGRFRILLSYDDPSGSGLIDEIRTVFSAVRLGDLSNNTI